VRYLPGTFGADPVGFWLPECAYAPGLEMIMQEANLRWFIVDAHGLMFGEPRPRRGIYAPSYTAAGPAAFARDRDSSRQVWSATEGYPGDPATVNSIATSVSIFLLNIFDRDPQTQRASLQV